MKFTRYLPLVALGAFAADCGEPPDDSDTNTDDFCLDCQLFIMGLNPVCNDNGNGSSTAVPRTGPIDDVINFDIDLGTWAAQVEIDVHETSVENGWDEAHILPESANVYPYTCTFEETTEPTPGPMPTGATSEQGYCDRWEFDITEVATVGEQTDGTTILNCAWWENGTDGFLKDIAVMVSVADDQTPAATDCVVFGHNSATEFASSNCLCFEGDSGCGDHNS